MSLMNVGIAIDGSGKITITYIKGQLRTIHLGVGPHAPIQIQEALETSFIGGVCNNNWFRTDVETASGDEFLVVRVQCPLNASMNFMPDGFTPYHVDPGTTQVLFYSRKSGFRASEETKKKKTVSA